MRTTITAGGLAIFKRHVDDGVSHTASQFGSFKFNRTGGPILDMHTDQLRATGTVYQTGNAHIASIHLLLVELLDRGREIIARLVSPQNRQVHAQVMLLGMGNVLVCVLDVTRLLEQLRVMHKEPECAVHVAHAQDERRKDGSVIARHLEQRKHPRRARHLRTGVQTGRDGIPDVRLRAALDGKGQLLGGRGVVGPRERLRDRQSLAFQEKLEGAVDRQVEQNVRV